MIGRDLARLAFEVGAEIDDRVAGGSRRPDRGIERGPRRAISSKCARAKAGSPGLQLSLPGSSSARRMASSTSRPYFATMARASASVVGSGTVGPEAIADGSSCGTSEIASVTISARWPARASRPPLIRDRCLRTVLISPIGAPERSSARVNCCFCAKRHAGDRRDPVRGAAARQQHQQEIVGSRARGELQALLRALQARPRRARDGRPRSP